MRLPLLVLHITAGTLAVLAGFTAIFLRKGSRQHGVAGNVFVISMLVLAVSAVYLAFLKHQMNNVFGGILTAYLVTTAWMTARRRDGITGVFDWVALPFSLAVGIVIVSYGIRVATSPTAPADGVPPRHVLRHGVHGSAGSGGRRSHAGARRDFRCAADCAPSLAHVVCAVFRHRLLLPGTAAGLPCFHTKRQRAFYPGAAAAGLDDLLGGPRLVCRQVSRGVGFVARHASKSGASTLDRIRQLTNVARAPPPALPAQSIWDAPRRT